MYIYFCSFSGIFFEEARIHKSMARCWELWNERVKILKGERVNLQSFYIYVKGFTL